MESYLTSQVIPGVQFSSVTQSCPTLCDPMDCRTLVFPVLRYLPELAQTHVHWVSDAYHPTISSSIVPFSSHLQSFPASGSFLMVWLFTSGGQANFASASAWVLSMNIQDWFPLGLTGLISLQSKGLSRVFSSTTVWKHQFFGAQPSSFFLVLSLPYGLTLTGLFVIHNKFLSITFDFMLMR